MADDFVGPPLSASSFVGPAYTPPKEYSVANNLGYGQGGWDPGPDAILAAVKSGNAKLVDVYAESYPNNGYWDVRYMDKPTGGRGLPTEEGFADQVPQKMLFMNGQLYVNGPDWGIANVPSYQQQFSGYYDENGSPEYRMVPVSTDKFQYRGRTGGGSNVFNTLGFSADSSGNFTGYSPSVYQTGHDAGGFFGSSALGGMFNDLVSMVKENPVLPIAINAVLPGAGAVIQAANAIDQGNVAAAASALANIPGASDLAGSDLTSAIKTVAQTANVVNALESGNTLGALTSGASLTGSNKTEIGDTGVTVGDALKAANLVNAVNTGNTSAAVNILSSLSGQTKDQSKDLLDNVMGTEAQPTQPTQEELTAQKNHQTIMDTFHSVLGRDPTPEEYQKFAGENAIQITQSITPTQAAQADNTVAVKLSDGSIGSYDLATGVVKDSSGATVSAGTETSGGGEQVAGPAGMTAATVASMPQFQPREGEVAGNVVPYADGSYSRDITHTYPDGKTFTYHVSYIPYNPEGAKIQYTTDSFIDSEGKESQGYLGFDRPDVPEQTDQETKQSQTGSTQTAANNVSDQGGGTQSGDGEDSGGGQDSGGEKSTTVAEKVEPTDDPSAQADGWYDYFEYKNAQNAGYNNPSDYRAAVALTELQTGLSGTSGVSGMVDTGTSGTSGTAISGTSGTSAESGTSGASGVSGISGTSGEVTGGSGVSGVSGYSGISGESGLSGYSGISGLSGYSGISGESGLSGYSGVSGLSGYSGISGESGISGYSGISGISGYSGISGESGISGYSGISGGSGYSGTSGVSGVSGLSGFSGLRGLTGVPGVDAGVGTFGSQFGSAGTSAVSTPATKLEHQVLTSKQTPYHFVSPLAAVLALSNMVGSEENQANQGALQMQTPHYNYGNVSSIDEILGMPEYFSGLNQPAQEEQAAQGGLMTSPLMAAAGGFAGTTHGRYAGGGLSNKVVHHSGKARVDFRAGDAVTGPGDGQSDDIPAMLADGEFVFPADVVAAIGNGSTKAGSDKLYDMMHGIRAHVRSAKPKDLPPEIKSPLDFLGKKYRKG